MTIQPEVTARWQRLTAVRPEISKELAILHRIWGDDILPYLEASLLPMEEVLNDNTTHG